MIKPGALLAGKREGIQGEEGWEEYMLTRALFGHLTSVATRPISEGNEIAIQDARRAVESLIERLAAGRHALISPGHLHLMRDLLGAGDIIPLHAAANAVVRPLHHALKAVESRAAGWPDWHITPYRTDTPLRDLVVSVGPTIGLGDEFILARAVTERAREVGVMAHVETGRFGLWRCLGGPVQWRGAPPLAVPRHIRRITEEEGAATGYVFADFLGSDPADLPAFVPEHLAYSGRWVFGDASGIIASPKSKVVHRLRYPAGLPTNRKMEADWMAARFLPLPASQAVAARKPWSMAARSKAVLVQVLTSKPPLIYPPEFYQETFRELRHLTGGGKTEVRVLAGPTKRSGGMTGAVAEAIAAVLGREQVTALPKMDLDGVSRAVADAGMLFGPDTFTAHLAAAFGVPQVTLYLPEHRAWLNPGGSAFYLAQQPNFRSLARAAAERMAWLLHGNEEGADSDVARGAGARGLRSPPGKAELSVAGAAHQWQAVLRTLEPIIRAYVQDGRPIEWKEVFPLIEQLRTIAREGAPLLRRRIATAGAEPPGFDFRAYPDHQERERALTRWHHELAISDLSGMLMSFPAMSHVTQRD